MRSVQRSRARTSLASSCHARSVTPGETALSTLPVEERSECRAERDSERNPDGGLIHGCANGRAFELEEVREALDLAPTVHLMNCDARERESVKLVLVALLEQILQARRTPALAG